MDSDQYRIPEGVRAVIFDMDGTLYRLTAMRIRMGLALFSHVLSGGWRDLFLILRYRKKRKILAGKSADEQFSGFALSEDKVADIIAFWMVERPLAYLPSCRFSNVECFFDILRARGIKIGVYSDYPVEKKLHALGLAADAVLCSSDVDDLKPAPKGLQTLVAMLNVSPNECIMIGDRADRDGLCAQAVGMNFLLSKGSAFYTKVIEQF